MKTNSTSSPSSEMAENIERLINHLPAAQTWQERFDVLMRLVDFWHGPCLPEDRIPEIELAAKFIPPPLLAWYRVGGKRECILDGFNQLVKPGELSNWRDEEFWHFYCENQGVYTWSLRYDPTPLAREHWVISWEKDRSFLRKTP